MIHFPCFPKCWIVPAPNDFEEIPASAGESFCNHFEFSLFFWYEKFVIRTDAKVFPPALYDDYVVTPAFCHFKACLHIFPMKEAHARTFNFFILML